MRAKVYSKSLDKITNSGVSNQKTNDPTAILMLKKDYNIYR